MIAALLLALTSAAEPLPGRTRLEGSWRTPCMPIGRNGRHGFITTLAVRGKKLAAEAQVYAHASCDSPTLRVTYRGTIVATRDTSDSIDLDQVVDAVEMTVNAADVIDAYNKPGSGCGFGGGWRLGAARDVAGRNCAPFAFPLVGTRLYERVWSAGTRLRLGSFPIVWANTAPERRPTSPGALVFERLPDDPRALSSPGHHRRAW